MGVRLLVETHDGVAANGGEHAHTREELLLKTIDLTSNQWNCSSCEILYLSQWIRENSDKVKQSSGQVVAPDGGSVAPTTQCYAAAEQPSMSSTHCKTCARTQLSLASFLPFSSTIRLTSNQWDCSVCEILYLSQWIRGNSAKVKDSSGQMEDPDDGTICEVLYLGQWIRENAAKVKEYSGQSSDPDDGTRDKFSCIR
ncbi:unnamed protein product [Lampetra fluviatilis]